MFIDKISAKTKNGDYNVIIEIPMNHDPVKYEFDKDTGTITVDRFIQTPMFYPCNYGFIPHTLSNDGDPVDVMVISHYPIISGAVIAVRPVGVLMMEDDSGEDEKILAVPISKIDKSFDGIDDIIDVREDIRDRVLHFFKHYKDLERGKWSNVIGWRGATKALELIDTAINRGKKG